MDRILQKSSTPTKPKENLQKKLIKKNLFQERQLDPTELVENIHGDLMESESISDHSSEDESSDEERSKEDLAINFPKKSLVGPSSFMLSNKYRPCNSLKKFTIQNSQLSDKEEQETEESEEDKEYKEEKQAYQEVKDRMDIEIKNNSPNQTNFNGKRKLFSRSNKKFRASKKRKFSYRKPLRISTNDQISAVPLEEKEVPFLEKDLFIEEDLEEDYAEFSNFSSREPIQFQMVESLEKTLKENFKFSSFRPGQRECIQNIVKKISTLLILPTGSGKSLCYQFPALLAPQNSIVLIISPLLSLVQDQIRTLPLCLTGAFLSSQQSVKENTHFIFFTKFFSSFPIDARKKKNY